MISYARYAEEQGFDPSVRRPILGTYQNVKSKRIVSGDDFDAIVVGDDAEATYRLALEYFNETSDVLVARQFVDARWNDAKN